MVAEVTGHVFGINADSVTMRYTYDKAGNPETVSRGENLLAKYSYDGLNRLRREDNHAAGKTFIWDYDAGGNIICKKEYPLCTDVNLGSCTDSRVYTYKSEGWRDRLHSVNGKTCTYDRLGNPISYFGHTLEWTKVRRLAGFDGNTFSYGASGIRYRKNNTVYTLDGSRILRESDGTKTLTYYHWRKRDRRFCVQRNPITISAKTFRAMLPRSTPPPGKRLRITPMTRGARPFGQIVILPQKSVILTRYGTAVITMMLRRLYYLNSRY